jgi:septal ring factor EnvC (AmiA/AmiB activator)
MPLEAMSMTDSAAIDAANKRLALALDALAAAVERRGEADREAASLSSQLHALGTDRARLASELDAATARIHALDHANREVARRIDSVLGSIRSLLGASSG